MDRYGSGCSGAWNGVPAATIDALRTIREEISTGLDD
jgi:hypothetical protein